MRCTHSSQFVYPIKTVAVGPHDPDFVTPLVKVLLNKKNRLRRRGKIEAANNLACKINGIIVSIRSKRLSNAAHGFAKDLWAQVRSKAKTRNKPILIGGDAVNADQLNQYFAGISTDPDSTVSGVTRFYRQFLAPPVAAVVVFSLSYNRILYGFYREFRKVLCSTS